MAAEVLAARPARGQVNSDNRITRGGREFAAYMQESHDPGAPHVAQLTGDFP